MKKPVVVITGGSAGVGRAIAVEFAKNQASVAVLARDPSRLVETQNQIIRVGGRGLGLACDVAFPDQIEAAARQIENQLGAIDVWINNATATVFSPIKKISPAEFERVTQVTYLGTVYGTMVALERMSKRNSGTIIQVGSALAYRSIPLQSAYSAAKHAIRGFTDALRVELAHDGLNIQVTMVQLPALNTPQFSWSLTHINKHPQPVPPIYQPEVAGRAIYWAAQHKRREVWVGKPAVATILMNKLIPGLVDQYLVDTGYISQFADKPLADNVPGNLFEPVVGKYGIRGSFSPQAKSNSWQFMFHQLPIIHYFTDWIFGVVEFTKILGNYLPRKLVKLTSP